MPGAGNNSDQLAPDQEKRLCLCVSIFLKQKFRFMACGIYKAKKHFLFPAMRRLQVFYKASSRMFPNLFITPLYLLKSSTEINET